MFKFSSVMPVLHIIMKKRICEWDFFVQNECSYTGVCVCVCVWERERERESMGVCIFTPWTLVNEHLFPSFPELINLNLHKAPTDNLNVLMADGWVNTLYYLFFDSLLLEQTTSHFVESTVVVYLGTGSEKVSSWNWKDWRRQRETRLRRYLTKGF